VAADRICYLEGVTTPSAPAPSPLFTALDVTTGAVIAECKLWHRQQGFISFLRRIDKVIHKELDLQLIDDNYCIQKHPKVKAWLSQRPRSTCTTSPPTPASSTKWSVGLD
jgi:putative transposase